jgi:hypothetical protein
MMMIIIITINL